MLPRINGKEIIDCDLSDLQSIIDNPSFAENEYLDYKKAFAVDIAPKEQKAKEQVEFRNDVCSFANAQGGYLIYGIEEKKGIPTAIEGIIIKGNNRDIFEREIKNYLQPIKPRVPYYQINFVEVSENKYVVILFVQHDYFAPYTQLLEQSNYCFYKRIGNSKNYIDYQELRTMFTQSLSLEKEIEKFRRERINNFMLQEDDDQNTYTKFLLLHIIPDTFLDSNYNKPVFAFQKKGVIFSVAFDSFYCNSRPYPMAEGLRFLGEEVKAECRLYDNGIAEYFCPLRERRYLCTQNSIDYIIQNSLWNDLYTAIYRYVKILNKVVEAKRVFVCVSLLGCKDAVTYEEGFREIVSKVDREQLICTPEVLEKLEEDELDEIEVARIKLSYLTALGISYDPMMDELIEKVYGKLKSIKQNL